MFCLLELDCWGEIGKNKLTPHSRNSSNEFTLQFINPGVVV